MHTFDMKTGWSCFQFTAPASERVLLVGDFNGWGEKPLPMRFANGCWILQVRLQAGVYKYGFQYRDAAYDGGVAEVPLWFGRMHDGWLEQAARACTCGKHFWKWN